MITELTKNEYQSTMVGKMTNVTATAEPVVDIWPYIKELCQRHIELRHLFENGAVDLVYRNSTNTFDHVLLPTDNKNIFIVIIVNIKRKRIMGHYRLDLEEEYGLK